MAFYIQASNPRLIKNFSYEDKSLSDAIENVFPLFTEKAILSWNYVSVPLSYKYDISYMADDIIGLLKALESQRNGEKRIHWLPDTFRCDWDINWDDGIIEIHSHWECTVGNLEQLLNENEFISLSVRDFESEWKEILHVVIRGLKNCGYDENRIAGMKDLLKQYARISNTGILYQNDE